MQAISRYWREILIGCLATTIYFMISALMPQSAFLSYLITSPLFDLGDKVRIVATSLAGFFTIHPPLHAALIIATSLLVGGNVALLTALIRRRTNTARLTGLSGIGLILGIIGTGCLSCGSVILVSLLGIAGAGTLTALLPFKGAEFSIVSIALLTLSIILVIQRLRVPAVCTPSKQ